MSPSSFIYILTLLAGLLVRLACAQDLVVQSAPLPVIEGKINGMNVVVQEESVAFFAGQLSGRYTEASCFEDLHCTMHKNHTPAVQISPDGIRLLQLNPDHLERDEDNDDGLSSVVLPSLTLNTLEGSSAFSVVERFISTEEVEPTPTLATLYTGHPVVDQTPALSRVNRETMTLLAETIETVNLLSTSTSSMDDEFTEIDPAPTEAVKVVTTITDELDVLIRRLMSSTTVPVPTPVRTNIGDPELESDEVWLVTESDDELKIRPSSTRRYGSNSRSTSTLTYSVKHMGTTSDRDEKSTASVNYEPTSAANQSEITSRTPTATKLAKTDAEVVTRADEKKGTRCAPTAPSSAVAKIMKLETKPLNSLCQKFFERVKNNRLAMRTIILETEGKEGNFRTMREQDYLRAPLPAPRPATLILPGLPQPPESTTSELTIAIDVSELEVLYPYKKDAGTSADMDPCDREKRKAKCLPPALDQLILKLEEMDKRRVSAYPERTSGHFLVDGSYRDGKPKEQYFGMEEMEVFGGCEVIFSGYREKDILAVVIYNTMLLIPDENNEEPDLLRTLQAKKNLERILERKLPLMFYNTHGGSVAEVFYIEEALSNEELDKGLEQTIKNIQQWCLASGFNVRALSSALWALGAQETLTRLIKHGHFIDELVETPSFRQNQKLINAVRSNEPLCAVKKLIDLGAHSGVGFLKLISNYFSLGPEVRMVSLVHMLGIDKTQTHAQIYPPVRDMRLSQQQKDILLNTRLTEESKKHNSPVLTLLPAGTDLAAYSVNSDDVRRNPDCCLTLLNHGAAVDFKAPQDCVYCLWYIAFSAPFAFMTIAPPLIKQCVRQYTCSFLDKMAEGAFKQSSKELISSKHRSVYKFILECFLGEGGGISNDILDACTENNQESAAYFSGLMKTEKAIKNRTQLKLLEREGVRHKDATEMEIPPVLSKLFELSPLEVDRNERLENLAEKVLNHYYRRLHPRQVVPRLLSSTQNSSTQRSNHGVDHVVRTMRINQALSALLCKHSPEKYGELFQIYPDLESILPLGMLYHDVVAEVEDKAVEEKRAADLFRKDMLRSSFPEKTVNAVADALMNKNVDIMSDIPPGYTADDNPAVSEHDRCLRRLLRLPDAIDITRVTTVPRCFPRPDITGQPADKSVFDSRCLDLDPELIESQDFMNDFYELMENALALASVSGGAAPKNLREQDYASTHGLISLDRLNPILKRHFEQCPGACTAMDQRLNDNVRREIVRMAGIKPLSDHQLHQIPLPEGMTLMDKFLINNPRVRQRLVAQAEQVARHKYQPPTGTLTQELLASRDVQKRLEEEYGLQVNQVTKTRGYNSAGEPNLVKMWTVSKEIHKSDQKKNK